MACPHFFPVESRGGKAMLPLGGSWTGLCHVNPVLPAQPENMLTCNLGYARGQCARFVDGPDAVRFAIAQHGAETLRVLFVQEIDHHPHCHGALEYSLTEGFAPISDSLLQRQATAYVESYFRRRQDA